MEPEFQRCKTCGQLKRVEEFAWYNQHKQIRQSRCKECFRAYHQKWYQTYQHHPKREDRLRWQREKIARARAWKLEYLQKHACVDCGITNPVVLEFDHEDKSEKYNRYTRIFALVNRGYSPERLEKEAAKCSVRCANCHRIKTAKEQGWTKLQKG